MNCIKNFFLNALLFFGKLLGMQRSNKAKKDRILIVSTTGFGDTLWATPSIASIKSSYPNASLAVLTSPTGKKLLTNSPHIDDIFVLKPSLFNSLKLLVSLRKKRFETVLLFHSSQRLTLPLISLLGAKEIIGTKEMSKGFDKLLTKAFEKPDNVHEIKRRLELSSTLNLSEEIPQMEVYPSSSDNKTALSYLPEKVHGPIIVFHPGAKDLFKLWSIDCFAKLGNSLEKKLNAHIYITGCANEKKLTDDLCKKLPSAHDLCNLLSPLELASFFKHVDLVITADTGPMHLAFATNTKTLALFSPTNPKLCGPFNKNNVTVIQKKQTCLPCKRKKCKNAFCMLQISPDEVFHEALALLQTSSGAEIK